MADDLGFGDLGRFNFGATRTPAIDSLAADGTMLTQHYSASPICAPARAAFLTGRYPQRSGVIDTFSHRGTDRISLGERTLGDLLGEAGYVTGLVGKWHSGSLGIDYHPNRRGFAEFVGFRGGFQDYWEWNLERNSLPFRADGRYLTDVLSDEAIQFVRRHRAERFFFYLAYTAPHGPFQAPPGDDPVGRHREPADRPGDDRGDGRTDGRRNRRPARGARTVPSRRRHPRDLHQRQRAVDETRLVRGHNGSLQPRVERRQRARSRGRDPCPDDRALARRDRFDPRQRTASPTSPTGFPRCSLPPATADAQRLPGDGVDLLPILRGEADPLDPPRFWQWSRYAPTPFVNAAMRDGTWKLRYPAVPGVFDILADDPVEERRLLADPTSYRLPAGKLTEPTHQLEQPAAQLFDLSIDPGEGLDLAARDPQRVGRMAARLAAWYDEVELERASLRD